MRVTLYSKQSIVWNSHIIYYLGRYIMSGESPLSYLCRILYVDISSLTAGLGWGVVWVDNVIYIARYMN